MYLKLTVEFSCFPCRYNVNEQLGFGFRLQTCHVYLQDKRETLTKKLDINS